MEAHQLGKSDLLVHPIGLGCMSLYTTPDKKAIRLIQSALDQGINFIDTADLYQYGMNEELIGEAIHDRRDQVVLATKVGNRWNPDRVGWSWAPSKQYIKEAVQASLRRLKVEYIDLYQLHGGTLEDPIDEIIEAFEELQQEGLIRYYGISSIRPNVIREYVRRSNIVSVMLQYSILDRRAEEELLHDLQQHSIAVITRGPLAKGLLTVRGAEKIENEGYLDYSREELTQLYAQLSSLQTPERSLTQIALQYILHHPAVTVALPGPRTERQLQEILQTRIAPPLTQEMYDMIQTWSHANLYTEHR